MSEIIQIVPTLPPAVSGVGDYALRLAEELYTSKGVRTTFVVCDPGWSGPSRLGDFDVTVLTDRSPAALERAVPKSISKSISQLLLHYVGYGYAKRGAPAWLVKGIRKLLQRENEARLFTIFHELSATGSVFGSAFWLSGYQTHLCKALANQSDGLLTSIEHYARKLAAWKRNDATLATYAVPSNIGTLGPQQVGAKRENTLVIFGGAAKRGAVYQAVDQLEAFCAKNAIETIVDIGPTVAEPPPSVAAIRFEIRGILPPHEISSILREAAFGAAVDMPHHAGKSGIVAAYAAHGVIPVLLSPLTSNNDGLDYGKHFVRPADQVSEAERIALSLAIHDWYRSHDWTALAGYISNCFIMPDEDKVQT